MKTEEVKKEEEVINFEKINQKKTAEALKEKRRKEHFFHGEINFPQ